MQNTKRGRPLLAIDEPDAVERFAAEFEEQVEQLHTDLLERFYQAADSGDIDRLLALLSNDVVMHTDGGGKAAAVAQDLPGCDADAAALSPYAARSRCAEEDVFGERIAESLLADVFGIE